MKILFLEQSGIITGSFIPILESSGHTVFNAFSFNDAESFLDENIIDFFIVGNPALNGLSEDAQKEADRLNDRHFLNYIFGFVWFKDLVQKGKATWAQAIFCGTIADELEEKKNRDQIKEFYSSLRLVSFHQPSPAEALLDCIKNFDLQIQKK